MMESGFTRAPGCRTTRSTWESVCAAIQRMSSGIRVPRPRTSRNIGPRFTSSVQTVARSTDGAAGRNFESPSVTPPKRSTATDTSAVLRIILARAFDGRGISMIVFYLLTANLLPNPESAKQRLFCCLAQAQAGFTLALVRSWDLPSQYRELAISLIPISAFCFAELLDAVLQRNAEADPPRSF